ncbi:MAG: formyltransferase family protein [Caldilineaceae bacterium]
MRQSRVDVACVACFNRIFPADLLTLPHGFLNLHPSLLPHYRGPDPIFWQLRDGVQTDGRHRPLDGRRRGHRRHCGAGARRPRRRAFSEPDQTPRRGHRRTSAARRVRRG